MQEMVLFGGIGTEHDDGISSKAVDAELRKIPRSEELLVYLNSPGGSVGEGLAIYELLRARGNCGIRVNGYALSAATVVMCGGEAVVAYPSSIIMIHSAMSGTYGNQYDHDKSSEMLQTADEQISKIYAAKTGKSEAEMLAAMKSEMWFTAAEAVEFGLLDALVENEPASNRLKNLVVAAHRWGNAKSMAKIESLGVLEMILEGAKLRERCRAQFQARRRQQEPAEALDGNGLRISDGTNPKFDALWQDMFERHEAERRRCKR